MIQAGNRVRLKEDAPEALRILEQYLHVSNPAEPLDVTEVTERTAIMHTRDCPLLLPSARLCRGACTNFAIERRLWIKINFNPPKESISSEVPACLFPADWFETIPS